MADGAQDEAEIAEENVDEGSAGEGGEEDGDIYEVEKIVGMCTNKGKTLYKVRWQGYTPQWDTWEPYENLSSCQDMIDAYVEETKKGKPVATKEEGEVSGFGDSISEKSDSSKKTGGPKKKRQAGYFYVSDDSEEADTLKDKFWRDLEHGKINVFESGDMYSKVKGAGVRQSRPQSFTEMYQGKQPPPANVTEEEPTKPGKVVKQRKKSDTQKPKKTTNKRLSTETGAAKKRGGRKRKSTEALQRQDSTELSLSHTTLEEKLQTEDSPADSSAAALGDSVMDFQDDTLKTSTNSKAEAAAHDIPSSSPLSELASDPFAKTKDSLTKVKPECDTNMDTDNNCADSKSPEQTIEKTTSTSSHLSSTTGSQSLKPRSRNDSSTGGGEMEHQPPSVGNTTAPLSVGESELSGDSGNVDIDSLPRSNNSLLNTCGEIADEEFEFDLDELDGMEWDGKMIDHSTMPLISSNGELRHAVKANDYQRVSQAFRTARAFDLEQYDHGGLSLAMIAAQHGYDDLLELLVMRGANIHTQQKGTGVTALMLAAEQGLRCTVALLLEMGAHVNSQTPNGETALIKAIRRSHTEVVKMLLDHGANFASTHCGEHTAMRCAKLSNHNEIIHILESHISRITAEFENQVGITLNNTATILTALFPIQCFALREAEKIKISFKHELEPTKTRIGMLLFIAHARINSQEARCRFYGPCAVTGATLNNVPLKPVTEESNFVMSFSPLHNGRNDLEIGTVHAHMSRAKLVVCAYRAELL